MKAGCARFEGAGFLAHPLAAAVVEEVNAQGYQRADVDTILHRGEVSRADFERHFQGKAGLVLSVLEAAIGDLRTRVYAAYASTGPWPDSLRAAAYETARWLIEHPETTRFAMVSATPAGDMARARREELFLWGASLVDRGRPLAAEPEAVPRRAGVLAIGAVVEELRRLQEGSLSGDIVASVPRMMYAAVRPYLGEEAARLELETPLPPDLEAYRRS